MRLSMEYGVPTVRLPNVAEVFESWRSSSWRSPPELGPSIAARIHGSSLMRNFRHRIRDNVCFVAAVSVRSLKERSLRCGTFIRFDAKNSCRPASFSAELPHRSNAPTAIFHFRLDGSAISKQNRVCYVGSYSFLNILVSRRRHGP